MRNFCRYFNSSPEVIGLTVMIDIRYPLSLRQEVFVPINGATASGRRRGDLDPRPQRDPDAAKDRNLAFVFQETAMFPNLSVRRNISFGLDVRKRLARAEIDRRVEKAARTLRIEQLLQRRPYELSGGPGQRVALGRAIVTEPSVFLRDEPLAALDAALRVEMRTEIKLIQRKLNCTMIFVTHDQEFAGHLSLTQTEHG